MRTFKKFTTWILILIFPLISHAHVAYVIESEEFNRNLGSDFNYLFTALSNPYNISIMLSTVALLFFAIFILKRSSRFNNHSRDIIDKLSSYHEFIPWIIRLSLGIAFIGAGTEQVLISPIISGASIYSSIQIALGFAFLLGFMLVPSAIIAIGLYFLGLYQNFYLIGNIDVLALSLGFLVFHSARPGVDDILNISLLRFLKIDRKYLALILRILTGVGFVFLALYEKILDPHISELVVSKYNLIDVVHVSPAMWVLSAGIIELLLGIIILIGFYTRTAACVGIIVLSTTFFFFKESVYSHVTLFGILSIIAIEGGGYLSLDKLLERNRSKLKLKI